MNSILSLQLLNTNFIQLIELITASIWCYISNIREKDIIYFISIQRYIII
jgi:hypothetical protein